MTSVGCCRLDYASNAGSLSAAASLVAKDYPMSWWLSRRLRPAPWDCCCWTNSSTDKRNLFRDYISTSGGESSPNLSWSDKKKKSFRRGRLEKAFTFTANRIRNWYFIIGCRNTERKSFMAILLFWSFFLSLWLSTLLGDCFESFSDELTLGLKAFGGNF